MSLYAIGDLHLSFGTDKPMDVFGGRWEHYTEKIIEGFAVLSEQDTCVICGDLSWGMSLDEAREDFLFLNRLPGKKIILKGNHDYWWTTATKAHKIFDQIGADSLDILHNNCFFYGDTAICGTRGWFYEVDRGGEHSKKIMLREMVRLETSLRAAGDRDKIVFLHYPPKYGNYECSQVLDLLEKYEVPLCCSAHIHNNGCRFAFEGTHRGTRHMMVSADHIMFKPQKILD